MILSWSGQVVLEGAIGQGLYLQGQLHESFHLVYKPEPLHDYYFGSWKKDAEWFQVKMEDSVRVNQRKSITGNVIRPLPEGDLLVLLGLLKTTNCSTFDSCQVEL